MCMYIVSVGMCDYMQETDQFIQFVILTMSYVYKLILNTA